jgi:AraC-like DNA-binding protein
MTPGAKIVTAGNRMAESIAAGFARALVDLAASKGADRGELLARSGIDPARLEDQDNRIPLSNYMNLMRVGKELSGDPALALHFGEAYDMSELSIVGLLGQAAESGGAAFAQLGRYTKLIADIDVEGPAGEERLQFERKGNELWLIDKRRNPNDFPEMTESSFARMVTTARRNGNGKMIIAVHVTHAAPVYRAEYDRIFSVPVTFASDWNGLQVDGAVLDFAPKLPHRYVFGILSDRAEKLLKELEASTTVRGRVESMLLPLLHTGEASMDVIANRMGMSRQTLFRRLKSEGTAFEKVLDGLRHRMAVNYLSGKKVSVNETAYLVGFAEPAAFSRAFKRWTGMSPKTMRNAAG